MTGPPGRAPLAPGRVPVRTTVVSGPSGQEPMPQAGSQPCRPLPGVLLGIARSWATGLPTIGLCAYCSPPGPQPPRPCPSDSCGNPRQQRGTGFCNFSLLIFLRFLFFLQGHVSCSSQAIRTDSVSREKTTPLGRGEAGGCPQGPRVPSSLVLGSPAHRPVKGHLPGPHGVRFLGVATHPSIRPPGVIWACPWGLASLISRRSH